MPHGVEGVSLQCSDCLETLPCAHACVSYLAAGANWQTPDLWHIDSGANVVLTNPEDPKVVSVDKQREVVLHSSTERVKAWVALISTPIGVLDGLVFPKAPRLIPDKFFREFDIPVVTCKDTGKRYPVVRSKETSNLLSIMDPVGPSLSPVANYVRSLAHFASDAVKTSKWFSHTPDDTNVLLTRFLLTGNRVVERLDDRMPGRVMCYRALPSSCAHLWSKVVKRISHDADTMDVLDITYKRNPKTLQPEPDAEDNDMPDTSESEPYIDPIDEVESQQSDPTRKLIFHTTFVSAVAPANPAHQACGCDFCQRTSKTIAPRRKGLGAPITIPGQLIWGDLCTTLPNSSENETIMFVMKDAGTGLVFTYPLRDKAPHMIALAIQEVVEILRVLREKQGSKLPGDIWTFHTDDGGEFRADIVQKCLANLHGQWKAAEQGRHVPAIESTIRRVLNGLRVNLEASGLPSRFWPHAASHWCRCHNINIDCYKDYLQSMGSPTDYFYFGELLFFKPTHERSKVLPAGAPAAFMGFCGRRGIRVAYKDSFHKKIRTTKVDENGRVENDVLVEPPAEDDLARLKAPIESAANPIRRTTFDGGLKLEGVTWARRIEGRPSMAFVRQYINLEAFCVPNKEGINLASPGMTPSEMAEWIAEHPVPIATGELSRSQSSSCIACRGRRRVHTRQGSCIYAGVTPTQEQRCRECKSNKGELAAWEMADGYRKQNANTLGDKKGTISQKKLAGLSQACSCSSDAGCYPVSPDAPNTPRRKRVVRLANHSGSPTETVNPLGADTPRSSPKLSQAADHEGGDPGSGALHAHASTIFSGLDAMGLWRADNALADRNYKVRAYASWHETKTREKPTWWNQQSDVALNIQKWNEEWDRLDRLTHSAFHDVLTADYATWQLHNRETITFRALALDEEYRACVTRKMTKLEKTSPRGIAAQEKEIKTLIDAKMFGALVDGHHNSFTNKSATVVHLAMLGFMKNTEKEDIRHVYKGRAVLLGDNLRYVLGNAPVKPEHRWWDRLSSSLASMEESRSIDAFALMRGYKIETVDFEAAYLQSHWPTDTDDQYCYVVIPKELWRFLPDKLNPHKHPEVQRPMWRMDRAGYGHPASGHIWCETFRLWLVNNGWQTAGRPGKGSCFRKGKMMVVSYVDDLKVAGPDADLAAFWAEVGQVFKWKAEPELLSEFLGTEYARFQEPRDGVPMDILHLSLTGYIKQTVQAFNDLYYGTATAEEVEAQLTADDLPPSLRAHFSQCRAGDYIYHDAHNALSFPFPELALPTPPDVKPKRKTNAVPPCQVSCNENIRSKYDLRTFTGGCCPTCNQNLPFDPTKYKKWPNTVPQNRHQVMIGRLLWISRVSRPDIGHAVSALGGRISCWDVRCDQQLTVLVGYLLATQDTKLEMAWPIALQNDFSATPKLIAELHTDADHRGGDKSQSAFLAWIKPVGFDVGGIPLHWMSKKQTIAADAVSAAEIVAAHLAFKEGLWPLMLVKLAMNEDPHEVIIRADNTVCLNHISGRPTDTVYFKLKAVDARGGFLTDMYNCGFFQCSHVPSQYNRSDPGTKVPSSTEEQTWFRSLLGLQLPRGAAAEARKRGWLATNGIAPPKPKGMPADVLAEMKARKQALSVPLS